MKIVILGLSISSSWGNGHATTWRSLIKALASRGHSVQFLERDCSWYANNRDLPHPGYCELSLYSNLEELQRNHVNRVAEADAVVVGSYVPEGNAVIDWVLQHAQGVTAFYDIDTPVTLSALAQNACEYLDPQQIEQFDIYLSFSGGPILDLLKEKHHARKAEAFYCSVDPTLYFPENREREWDLGYLGTYSEDRQAALEGLLVEPARRSSEAAFVVAGPNFPTTTWPANIHRIEHLAPNRHRPFYNRQRFTLNVTRAAMVRSGWSPSVRLFEAAACATPIISDSWEGLDHFFKPGEEILTAVTPSEVLGILRDVNEEERVTIGQRAAHRILQEHTSDHRAMELENLLAKPASASAHREEAFV